MQKLFSKSFTSVLLPIVIEVNFMDIWCNASKELCPQKCAKSKVKNKFSHRKPTSTMTKDEILLKIVQNF